MSADLPKDKTFSEKNDLDKKNALANRVIRVHKQTRQGLLIASLFVISAVLVQVFGVSSSWWLSLHLFAIGGLLSAISAVTQMLAVTWSTSPAPSKLIANIQRWVLVFGAISISLGREMKNVKIFEFGAGLVFVSMFILIYILIVVRSQAQTKRFCPVIEAYIAGIITGTIGIFIGVLLGRGYVSYRPYELREVHIILNLYGLIGLIIAGTLPFFVATQVRSKMSKRATPKVMRTIFFILFVATLISALGFFFGNNYIAASGLILYMFGLFAIIAILPIYSKSKIQWAGPRIIQLISGILWWALLSGALAVMTIAKVNNHLVLEALIVGGFAQILIASFAYLTPVLLGGGHKKLTNGFAITRSWESLILGNLASLALILDLQHYALALMVLWLLDVVIRGVSLIWKTRRLNVC